MAAESQAKKKGPAPLPVTAYLTIEEAAAHVGCAACTIYRRVRAGELVLHRVLGRSVIEKDELDRLGIPGGRWKSPKSGRKGKANGK